MGSEVIATCDCGNIYCLAIGGGMFNFQYLCLFPCYCRKCNSLVIVNLLSDDKKCPECNGNDLIPYDNNEMIGSVGDRIVTQWNSDNLGRELHLTNGSYYCPKCKNFTLRFEDSGTLWD